MVNKIDSNKNSMHQVQNVLPQVIADNKLNSASTQLNPKQDLTSQGSSRTKVKTSTSSTAAQTVSDGFSAKSTQGEAAAFLGTESSSKKAGIQRDLGGGSASSGASLSATTEGSAARERTIGATPTTAGPEATTGGEALSEARGGGPADLTFKVNAQALDKARKTGLGKLAQTEIPKHAAAYQKASELTGVPAEMIAAIHGNESQFGTYKASSKGPESGFGLDPRYVTTKWGNEQLEKHGLGKWERGTASEKSVLQSAVIAAEHLKRNAGYAGIKVDSKMNQNEIAGAIASYTTGTKAAKKANETGQTWMMNAGDSNPHPLHPGGTSIGRNGETIKVPPSRKEGLLRWDSLLPIAREQLNKANGTPTTPTAPANPTSPTNPTSPATPTSPTNPTAPTAPTAPANPTTPANPSSPTSKLAQLAQDKGLKTNQDAINHFHKVGGGTWSGAQKAAKEYGADLNQLVKDRDARLNPSDLSNARGGGPYASSPSLDEVKQGKVIERGQGGRHVQDVQDRLNQLGYKLDTDGKFGGDTEKAIKQFQKDNGVQQTGKLGPTTLEALQKAEVKPRADFSGLKNVIQRGGVLEKGENGAGVADAQRMLTKAGFGVEATGQFGPTTEAAVKDFQKSKGIEQTGKIGTTTYEALKNVANPPSPSGPSNVNGPSAVRDTSGMTESQKYDYYKGLIEQNGGQLKTGPNQRNLVGLRTETDADVNGGQGRYDDKMAMLWTDSQGNKRVREYNANTEPSARYRGRMGVDANGDGRLDQGRLPSGYYEFQKGYSDSLGNVLRPTRATNAERDTNQDGLFNDNKYASAGYSILFHKGGNSMTGSAGCQTFPPGEWNRFWNDINSNGNPGTVGYTLINVK